MNISKLIDVYLAIMEVQEVNKFLCVCINSVIYKKMVRWVVLIGVHIEIMWVK